MASADVLSMPTTTPTFTPFDTTTTTKRKRETKSHLPPGLDKMISQEPPQALAFEPEKHLNFKFPSKIYSMKEIGMEDRGVSPNAVSEPFQLFTPEAIKQMRAETLRSEVFENCQYSSNLAKGQLRGFAPKYVHLHESTAQSKAYIFPAMLHLCTTHGEAQRSLLSSPRSQVLKLCLRWTLRLLT